MCEERLYSTNTVKQGCQNSFLGGRNISGYRFNQQLIQTWDTRMEEQRNPNSELFQHKGFNLIRGVHDSEHIDSLKTFEVREDDILVVTYPKSGTTWMQYIISLMFHESEMTQGDEVTMKHVPWLEVKYPKIDFGRMSSPRTFVSHLPTLMVPDGFKRKGKVMYISRNPKDVAVSFYHFHNVFKHLENKGSLVKISSFFGKHLDAETIDGIIEKSHFHNMRKNPKANYANNFPEYFDNSKDSLLRKGKSRNLTKRDLAERAKWPDHKPCVLEVAAQNQWTTKPTNYQN
ncbi:amine sulfotransferase-like isoform X1 [Esox lucius]|uniref:amine sulfotransferase-like isoform X1 n=1 Tax=Esox lucius TaxID=8010 RepID=UPI0014771F7E|nr:amine sulfotransferase-like isoform X1 [Esox lucius]